LKPEEHCRKAANNAMEVLKQIIKCFHYREKNTFVKLYKLHVGPGVCVPSKVPMADWGHYHYRKSPGNSTEEDFRTERR
jgi:predicted YcjX-like family ATPase